MGRSSRAWASFALAILACLCWSGAARAQTPTASDFQKVTLDDNTQNPMELDIANDGRVFYIERDGRLQIWKPNTQQTVTAGTIPVTRSQENGLLGLQLAPDFDTSKWVYLFYSQLPDSTGTQVVSRFKVNGDTLDLTSEEKILTFQHQTAECCHSSGSLYFGPDGSLYISTGDNTNPFDSSGFNPIDERSGRAYWDAQRTAGNTNDLNGKILKVKPMTTITGTPGVGTTYTIPAGNLFAEGTAKTRPEIYGMGFRNPFRFTVDPETGWVLGADYGPDASTTNANRGPQGSVEYNVLTKSGNYGWPYCIRDNTPYNDYDFATSTSGAKFDCANLKNESPNNTGLTNLPPAIGATAWMGYSETDSRVPGLGTGGAPMGGPRYHYDPNLVSARKFPSFYDDKWFIAEWNNGWIKTADLGSGGAMTAVQNFALGTGYKRPMDLDFGPDGALYVIEWGSGFNGDNADSGVYRIDYISGQKAPIAQAKATPSTGLAPLAVSFSSAGSSDPEGTTLTYAWEFGDGGTSTLANPSHTYTANGAYTAKLTVTDGAGLTAVANVPITVGNRPPVITIEFPKDGQVASFTDKVNYKISVTDPEDGTTGAGISCDDVKVDVALGHDEHSHTLSSSTGCTGTLSTGLTSGHGAEANTFTVLGVSYTDKGSGGAPALTGRAQAILQPKTKQAEFFASTGRVADGGTNGDAGVTKETTTDTAGGGQNIGFIEDGDYVSFKPYNLENTTAMRFRVASAGAGGTIEVRLDSPTGTLVGTTANITPTGDWQVYKDVQLDIATPPTGTHELFLVFRNRGSTQNLFNVNWFEVVGKGAAVTASPEATISATPTSGAAPLTVAFDTTATDSDGGTLAYAWDFGVPGTTTDVSTAKSPSYTYTAQGVYTATLTVTDGQGGSTTKTINVTVAASSSCVKTVRDDFDGTDLGSDWSVVRRDQTLVVNNGTVTMPAQAGDVYQTSNNAKNLVLRTAPTGPFTITTKLNFKGAVQYQQAGLLVYGDDDNYTKFDRVATNTSGNAVVEKFEFINEVAGTPRNASADASGNLPQATFPNDFYMRVKSDGTNITGEYSIDGTTWTAVGRSAALPANAKIGIFALSNAAATNVDAKFDWVTVESPLPPSAHPGDEFPGTSLDKTRWNSIVREDATKYSVAGGNLTVTTVLGDINTTSDPAGTRNFMLQSADRAPTDYVLETKVSGTFTGGYSQGGLIIYTDDDNYVKLDAISDQNQTRINRIELRSEQAGATQNPQPQASGTTAIPTGTANFWLRLTKTGTTYKGEYSLDGTTWVSTFATVANTQTAPKFGLFTISGQAAGVDKTVVFDYFKFNGSTGCGTTSNASPVISSATATPSAGFAPLAVNLAAAATDADNDALTYSWDFDSNGTADATGATASTTFTTAGAKTVKLTVSDGKGGTATRDVPVTVLAADDTSKRFRALVFSKTAAFRHDSIPAGIAAVQALGNQYSFQVDATEDGSLFRDDVLSHYDVVIWMSTTGDVLTDTQQAAFERFIKAGGGYAGVHSSTDTEYTWPWYGQLVGAYFRNHPAGTPTATVVREDKTDPSTVGLQDRWQRTDEWYNFQSPVNPVVNGGGVDYSPRATSGTHVLLTMDESTYAEDDGSDGTDDDHPISWCRKFDGGRMWYTGMGHTQASFSEADFLKHMLAGIEIAAGVQTSNACGIAAVNHDPTVSAQRTPSGDVTVGDPIAFSATGADSDNDALTYAWDFGDGGTATTAGAMHTYTAAGTFTAKVTVSDGKGGTASATLTVVVKPENEVSTPVNIGGSVPGVLALNISGSGNLGTFQPGVSKDYTASLAATATSTASSSSLTVRDPSATATGHLVNGTASLRSALQVRATDAANPNTAFAPLSESGARVNLLAFPAPVSERALTIGFKQSIAADEPLNAGGYGKTLVFTLSATTP